MRELAKENGAKSKTASVSVEHGELLQARCSWLDLGQMKIKTRNLSMSGCGIKGPLWKAGLSQSFPVMTESDSLSAKQIFWLFPPAPYLPELSCSSVQGDHCPLPSRTQNQKSLHFLPWKKHPQGWRDGSAVKNTGCSSKDPGFNSRHPHPLMPVYDSSSRASHSLNTNRHTCGQNTDEHKRKRAKKKKKERDSLC